jgi:hypothetical protein
MLHTVGRHFDTYIFGPIGKTNVHFRVNIKLPSSEGCVPQDSILSYSAKNADLSLV